MDTVDAFWVVELNCYCPGCKQYVDLLDVCNFMGETGIQIGEVETERTKCLDVSCPECGHEFKVTCCF